MVHIGHTHNFPEPGLRSGYDNQVATALMWSVFPIPSGEMM